LIAPDLDDEGFDPVGSEAKDPESLSLYDGQSRFFQGMG
jgi:hypothetical protein